jgi:hypothetical protein
LGESLFQCCAGVRIGSEFGKAGDQVLSRVKGKASGTAELLSQMASTRRIRSASGSAGISARSSRFIDIGYHHRHVRANWMIPIQAPFPAGLVARVTIQGRVGGHGHFGKVASIDSLCTSIPTKSLLDLLVACVLDRLRQLSPNKNMSRRCQSVSQPVRGQVTMYSRHAEYPGERHHRQTQTSMSCYRAQPPSTAST